MNYPDQGFPRGKKLISNIRNPERSKKSSETKEIKQFFAA
jgi:hypothetical protein